LAVRDDLLRESVHAQVLTNGRASTIRGQIRTYETAAVLWGPDLEVNPACGQAAG